MTLPTFTDGVLTNAAALNALSTGVNNLSTASLGANPPRAYVPQVKLTVTSQSITNNTATLISWGTVLSNTDTMWSSGTPTQVTIQTAGSYMVVVELGWTANASGGRTVWVLLNGTAVPANSVAIDEQAGRSYSYLVRGNTHHSWVALPGLTAGNTLFTAVQQTSGGALATCNNVFEPSVFAAWRIGP